jgi:hypothetical protein
MVIDQAGLQHIECPGNMCSFAIHRVAEQLMSNIQVALEYAPHHSIHQRPPSSSLGQQAGKGGKRVWFVVASFSLCPLNKHNTTPGGTKQVKRVTTHLDVCFVGKQLLSFIPRDLTLLQRRVVYAQDDIHLQESY